MLDLQEQLIRASAIARLDGIIGAIAGSLRAIELCDRAWLADLLHPLAGDGGHAFQLTNSASISHVEGSAIIEVLLEEHGEDAWRDVAALEVKLKEQVSELAALRAVLLGSGEIDPAHAAKALSISKKLRRHFLGPTLPSSENADGIFSSSRAHANSWPATA